MSIYFTLLIQIELNSTFSLGFVTLAAEMCSTDFRQRQPNNDRFISVQIPISKAGHTLIVRFLFFYTDGWNFFFPHSSDFSVKACWTVGNHSGHPLSKFQRDPLELDKIISIYGQFKRASNMYYLIQEK